MTIFGVVLLGIGLAIDACCVCTVSGFIYKPNIRTSLQIALPFAIFQGIMPLIGYFGIGLLPDELFQYNHIIAFVLLAFVGLKMLIDGIRFQQCAATQEKRSTTGITFSVMFMQGVSTSIDALSVGVTLGNESLSFMLRSVCIIALITFIMCFAAVRLGEKIGTKFNCKAEIFGGIILILLGISLLFGGI